MMDANNQDSPTIDLEISFEQTIFWSAIVGIVGPGKIDIKQTPSMILASLFFPQTLFFGERQIEDTIATAASLGVAMLLGIALAKLLAICMTLHCGFRGGFIFPLFFVGANVG